MIIVSGLRSAISSATALYEAIVAATFSSPPRPTSGTMRGGCGTINEASIGIVGHHLIQSLKVTIRL